MLQEICGTTRLSRGMPRPATRTRVTDRTSVRVTGVTDTGRVSPRPVPRRAREAIETSSGVKTSGNSWLEPRLKRGIEV